MERVTITARKQTMGSMDYKHLLNVEVCLIINRRKKAFEHSVDEQNLFNDF